MYGSAMYFSPQGTKKLQTQTQQKEVKIGKKGEYLGLNGGSKNKRTLTHVSRHPHKTTPHRLLPEQPSRPNETSVPQK